MRSTFSGLNSLVRGIYANQISLDTVGHNISNANTEGYSRQRVNLVTSRPEDLYGAHGYFQLGTGVQVQSVTRARDNFIDKQMWKETSTLGYGEAIVNSFNRIEGIFSETANTGIQQVLNKFWTAAQTVGANGSDMGAREVFRQRGVELVDAIKHAGKQLADMVADVNDVLDIKVNNINQITSEILSLNKQISNVEVGGDHANDLRDRRDLLVDQLSKLTKVNVYEDKSGNYIVQMPGVTLVDSESCVKLKTKTDNTSEIYTKYGYEVRQVVLDDSTEVRVTFADGEMKGLIEGRDGRPAPHNEELPGVLGYLNNLDSISRFLLKDFNEIHNQGYGLDNEKGTNFFGVNGKDYSSFSPSPSSGGWINELKVNERLFAANDGLNRIAAKTLDGNIVVSPSDINGGAGKVNVLNYSGVDNLKFKVKLDAVDADGKVTGITCKINDVDVPAGNITASATDPKIFTINHNGTIVTFSAAQDKDNSTDDIYTFSVPQGNASGDNAVRLAQLLKAGKNDIGVIAKTPLTKSNPAAGNAMLTEVKFANGGDIKFDFKIQVDATGKVTGADNVTGGWSFDSKTDAGDGTVLTFINGDNKVSLKISTAVGNTAGDEYNVKISETFGNPSLDTFYTAMTGSLGVQAQDAKRLTENQQTLVGQITNWREAVSGVNLDEEMTNMIRFQKGYNAAARVLTTMDEMLDKLINGTGVVGR